MKTSELTGAALDWAVAQAQGLDYEIVDGTVVTGAKRYEANSADDYYGCEFDEVFAPSTDWAQGGPIIEREGIDLKRITDALWDAHMRNVNFYEAGSTPLIAAMRCFVALKLGDEIEIPEGLKQ
ncbi:MAG: DUF2591 domain-containing protein [Proteobacteria bacterium]|nr:DUF2591 domain-containing protein [Pseudomonadota bacterium]